jgi:hypothetical protein
MATRDMIDIYINNKKCDSVDRKELFGYVVGMCMAHLPYMSKEAMIEWILESCFMLEETLPWKANTPLKRKITYIRNYIDRKGKYLSRDMTMNFVTNVVLSGQGLGTLSGFKFGKSKSGYTVNPEIMSTRYSVV